VRRHGRLNTCSGCLPTVTGVQRLLPVLAARQKLPPETAAEGKLLAILKGQTDLNTLTAQSRKQLEILFSNNRH